MDDNHLALPPPSSTMTELDMCKTALCFKEHEIFALRNDVQTQHTILQNMAQSLERLKRTMSAGMDRLARTVNRLGKREMSPPRKRKRDY